MNDRHLMRLAALTSVAFLSGSAIAADAGLTTQQMQNGSIADPVRGSTQNRIMPSSKWVGGSERVDNSSVAPIDTWMNDYAATHEGRISRRDFFEYMGRRWDTLDDEHRGYLTPDEAREVYSPVYVPR